MRTFDLVVIGAGPGGYVAAIRAAQLGLRAAVVEKDRPGGVCVNWGCIPSKAILKSADLYRQMQNAADYGITVKGLSVDYGQVIRRSRKVAERMSKGVSFLFRKNGVEMIAANAVISSPTTVKAGDEEIGAKNILVAVGTAVRGLPGIAPDGKTVLTSDDALAQETIPGSVVVLGGGAVGVEFAYIYRTFGADVAVVEMEDQLLPRTDREVAKELEKSFKKQGIRVLTSAPAKGLDKAAGALIVSTGGKEFLVAVGRKPLTDGLGLEACGVKLTKGYIDVDDSLRTACPTIYAIGDVIGGMLLAHEASAEGVAAAEIIAGLTVRPPDARGGHGGAYGGGGEEEGNQGLGVEVPVHGAGACGGVGAYGGIREDGGRGTLRRGHRVPYNRTRRVGHHRRARPGAHARGDVPRDRENRACPPDPAGGDPGSSADAGRRGDRHLTFPAEGP